MKRILSVSIFMVVMLLMISCDNLTKISETEGLQKAESTVKNGEYADLDYVQIKINSDDILSEYYKNVDIEYYDPKVNKVMQQFHGGSNGFSDPKALLVQPKKYETFKVGEIDFSIINQKTTEAMKMVVEENSPEYEGFTLSTIFITKVKEKIKIVFHINMTKVGEGRSAQGSLSMINYYQIKCIVEDDGKITLKDN